MKKWLLLIGLVIVLVACNNEEPINENNNVNDNEMKNEENNGENVEGNGENVENNEQEMNGNNITSNNQAKNDENNDDLVDEKTTEDVLIEKVYEIFAAQRKYDYDYLSSVLAEGAELDEENNTFTFNKVSYPHEQEFLNNIAEDDLEFRYSHEEDDSTVIVGFAAIDYENESSFVIDFEFVLDGNEWKMNDMDINK